MPLDALAAALAELDRAADRCVALALTRGLDPDARQAATDQAVDAYEMADRRVELMLSALIGAGGCGGLLAALHEAGTRAAARDTAVRWQWLLSVEPSAPFDRAMRLTEHAMALADARYLRVSTEIALPWHQRRVAALLEQARGM